MKIVQGDELQLERGLEHRGGTFHFRRLMEGEPGRADNFQVSLGQMGGDFYSPRHRHNFEQVRFQLAGTLDYARDGKLTPGMVGYFPEGMSYGPQSQDPDDTPMTVVLQCGGASGSGYVSRNEVKTAMDELSALGTFEGGVFRRNEDMQGKRNLDGYQAIWEHRNGRAMEYPRPRYENPVFMDPANAEWQALAGAPGVAEKALGEFTECRTRAGFLKLDPGAAYKAEGRAIFFAVSGAGEVNGEPLRALTTIFLDWGESATLKAAETAEILHMGLPDLRAIMAAGQAPATASAAE